MLRGTYYIKFLLLVFIAFSAIIASGCSSSGGNTEYIVISTGNAQDAPGDNNYPFRATLSFAGISGEQIFIRAGTPGWLGMNIELTEAVTLNAGDKIEMWSTAAVFFIAPAVGLNPGDFVTRVTTDSGAKLKSYFVGPKNGGIAGLMSPMHLATIEIQSGTLHQDESISLLLTETSNYSFRMMSFPIAFPTQGVSFKLVRAQGDVFEDVINPVEITVIGGRPYRLRLIAPSNVNANEPFSLIARVEDLHGNLSNGYSGTVQFTAVGITGLPASYVFQNIENGVHIFDNLTISSAGVYRISAEDTFYEINGTSNPIEVFASPPGEYLYWGDLHCHSYDAYEIPILNEITDPGEIFRKAHYEQGLDFLGLSTHIFTHSPDSPTLWWPLNRASAAQYYVPGEYVTFLGYEWRGDAGDHNVLYPDDVASPFSPDISDIATLYDEADAAGALVIPHVGGVTADLNYHDDRVQSSTEITSLHRHSEWFGHKSLNFGNKTGFVGGSDNHLSSCGGMNVIIPSSKSYPTDLKFGNGYNFGGLTAVYSPGLTRADVHDAIRQRHTYATTGTRIILDVKVDGYPMGSEYTAAAPPTINVHAIGTNDITVAEIIRNDYTIHEVSGVGKELDFSYTDPDPPNGQNYYYVRISQVDDEFAWSSPVWVNQTGLPSPPPPAYNAWNYDRNETSTPEEIDEANLHLDEVVGVLTDVGAGRLVSSLVPFKVIHAYEGDYFVGKTIDPTNSMPVRVEYYVDRTYRVLRMWPGWMHYGQYEQ